MSYQIQTVNTNGVTMPYLQFGAGERPLVILPGLSVQSVLPAAAAIEQQYAVFSEAFTVYLFDRRENLPATYSVAEMAEDTAAAMRAVGLSEVCLFGTSQGGMMAMAIAAEHPELVSRLALASTACRMEEKKMAGVEQWITLARQGKREELYLSFGEKLYPPAIFAQSRELLCSMAATATESELARFIVLAEALHGFDITDGLKKIACPVFVIGDTEDHVLGSDAFRELVAQWKDCPQMTSYLYRGFGHAVYDTAPDVPQRLYHFFTPA